MTKTREKKRRKMYRNNFFRTNKSWNNYIEAAFLIDDTSRLLYRRCDLDMTHFTSINLKNKFFRNHWINKTCNKLIIQKYSNVNIEIALQKIFHKFFSQIFLTNVFAKIKKIFDTIFTIEIQRERFSEIIDERNTRN
jgi:hypothetical protein